MMGENPAPWGARVQRMIRRVQHVAGVITVFMALVVMGGWFARNGAVVQIYHEFAPMQFNTALGFLWVGLALCVIHRPWRRFHTLLGVALIVLGLASVSQYLFHIDWGIDTLIVEPFTTVRTSHPGRMAPNTAVCFVLSGLALLCVGARRFDGAACIGTVITALGLVSIFGYLSGVDSAYGWGDLTRMALHTSVGFIILGLGLVLELVVDLRTGADPRVISVVVALLSITCSLAIWQALLAEHSRTVMTELQQEADRAASGVSLVFGQTLDALARFAYRAAASEGGRQQPEHRLEDSARYLEDFTGLARLSWISPERGERWAHDRTLGDENVPPLDEELALARRLQAHGVAGSFLGACHPSHSGKGGTMVLGTVATGRDATSPGLLIAVIEAAEFFPPVLSHTAPELSLRMRVQGTDLFEQAPTEGQELLARFTATSTTAVPGGDLQLELTATRAYVVAESSGMGYVVLFGGLLITGLLTLSTHLAVRNWQAQVAFRRQYSRHRLMVNHLPAMIAAFDADHHLIFANAPFVALVGATSEEAIIGRTPREMLGPYFHEVSHHLERVLAGDTVRYEVTVASAHDRPRCLETQLVPHRRVGEAVDSYYALVLDVTEERESARCLGENAERLQRFSRLAVGREERMIALKEEVNELLRQLDRAERYKIVSLEQDEGEGAQ